MQEKRKGPRTEPRATAKRKEQERKGEQEKSGGCLVEGVPEPVNE